jgi:signal transduction histidine kinase
VTRSILAVPLTFRGKTVGVLEAVNKANESHYNDEDVIILETLASQAAIAIENRRLLEESQQAYRKAIELDHMKSDFIAIASHELRTPLGVILGHASFLEETVPPDLKEEMSIIVRSSLRLKDIIENLSSVDQFENGLSRLRSAPVVIQQLIQEVTDSLRDLSTERQVKLVLHMPRQPQRVECDRGKIALALRELVKNGLTFTNPGGQVHVRCESEPGYIRVSVIDNGIGIAPAEQEKIFERFYQVESHLTRHHNGMGLGLPVARNMVEMHGGRLWVESVEGRGSRFTFLLPAGSVLPDVFE